MENNTNNENSLSNEQRANIGKKIVWESEIKTAEANIKKAKLTLFGIGVLYIIFAVLSLFASNIENGVVTAIVGGLFISLSTRVNKQPKVSIAIGLILILIFYLSDLIIDPSSITRGLFVKVLVVTALFFGLYGAINAEKIRKKYAELE
jgi:hypothetical protein